MSYYTSDPNTLYPDKSSLEDNPFGQYTQSTYQMKMNAGQHSFKDAFRSNKPLIEKQNFANQNNVLHNNLHANLSSDTIIEYTIDIDSKDRDINTYVDPFSYNVMFAPTPRGIIKQEEWIDPTDHSKGKHMVNTLFSGPPPPYIRRAFKNVKYIRVDNVTLPKYYGIVDSSGTWILDTTKDLTEDRYIVMKFKNIDSQYNLSTNSVMESNGVKLIPDTIPLNGNFYYAVPANANNVINTYKTSLLGNLDKLYIEFYDSTGTKLSYTNLDPTQTTSDVRNPLNKYLQNNMTLIFGIAENEMATEVKYFE